MFGLFAIRVAHCLRAHTPSAFGGHGFNMLECIDQKEGVAVRDIGVLAGCLFVYLDLSSIRNLGEDQFGDGHG